MNDVIFARALHVLAVVIWIGGVAMATTVVLPAVRRGDLGKDRLRAFQAIEHRFVWQARTAVIVVGLTGFYMIWRLDLWNRFQSIAFWWMHAMVCVWLLFAFVLFVAEPFILHRRFHRKATERIGCCWRSASSQSWPRSRGARVGRSSRDYEMYGRISKMAAQSPR
jgi:uncharacterized membrane protein